jgi:hypothetical protein
MPEYGTKSKLQLPTDYAGIRGGQGDDNDRSEGDKQ